MLVRQRPGTAGGVCFITIEDETGFANLVVFEKLFDTYRRPILHAKLLMVEGTLQREGQVIHVIVKKCFDFSGLLKELDNREATPYAAENKRSQIRQREDNEAFHGGRNFR